MNAPQDNFGTNLPEQRLARQLLTGEVDFDLYDALIKQFPATPRTSVYMAITLAWTDREAALLCAESEIRNLRRQLEQRPNFGRRAA